MTIPAKITAELTSLQAQVIAATPLINAPHANIKAIQLNAINLVDDVQTALTTTKLTNLIPSTDSTLLDGWIPPADAATIISGVLAVVVASDNQHKLSLLRGVVGRATSNLILQPVSISPRSPPLPQPAVIPPIIIIPPPPDTSTEQLDFSDPDNSQYLPLLP